MSRVLMIGLDGATWDLIKPWSDEGKLPTFRRLLNEGVHGELESTIPCFTIPAWNCLATGKNPGKLGVFTFLAKEADGYEFKFSRSETNEDVWKVLSDNGKKVVVVNAPNIHFAYPINGALVAGWLYRGNEELTYPKALKMVLDNLTGGYEMDVMDIDMNRETDVESIERNREKYVTSLGKNGYIKRIFEVTEKRFKAIAHLLKDEWDFAFVVFVAPDRIQHVFWNHKEILLDGYKKLDHYIGKLLSLADKGTTVLLVSDHGFGPKRRIFNINEWLLKEGYLNLKNNNTNGLIRIERVLRNIKILSFAERLLDFLPVKVSGPLKEFWKGKARPIRVESMNIDWNRTKVFAPPFRSTSGDLYLNMKGRERAGIINPNEYEKTRDEIISKLRIIKDAATRETISVRTYKREQIYWGEYVNKAPDLVIAVDNEIQAFDTSVGYGQVFMEGNGGEHRVNGIFLAYGPHIKKGEKIGNLRIYDIVPTVLHIFNLPIPTDIDGKVLREIFEHDSELSRRESSYSISDNVRCEKKEHAWSEQEEEKVKERLRKLGYI